MTEARGCTTVLWCLCVHPPGDDTDGPLLPLDEIALGTLRAAFKARAHKSSDGSLVLSAPRLAAILSAVPGLGDALPGDIVLASQQVGMQSWVMRRQRSFGVSYP